MKSMCITDQFTDSKNLRMGEIYGFTDQAPKLGGVLSRGARDELGLMRRLLDMKGLVKSIVHSFVFLVYSILCLAAYT